MILLPVEPMLVGENELERRPRLLSGVGFLTHQIC